MGGAEKETKQSARKIGAAPSGSMPATSGLLGHREDLPLRPDGRATRVPTPVRGGRPDDPPTARNPFPRHVLVPPPCPGVGDSPSVRQVSKSPPPDTHTNDLGLARVATGRGWAWGWAWRAVTRPAPLPTQQSQPPHCSPAHFLQERGARSLRRPSVSATDTGNRWGR